MQKTEHQRSKRALAVTLQRVRDPGLSLQITDNGLGMPTNRSGRRGLGPKLMHGFARQLNGVLSMSGSPTHGSGTVVTLGIVSLESYGEEIHSS